MTRRIVAPFCLLALVGLACGDSAKGGPQVTGDPSVGSSRQIRELESRLGFQILLPQYLPSSLGDVPTVYYRNDGVSIDGELLYTPRNEVTRPPAGPTLFSIRIIEAHQPDNESCTPCLGSPKSAQRFSINGLPASAQEMRGDRQIIHDVRFRAGAILVVLHLDWEFPDGAPALLSDEMRTEGLKTAESMLPD